MKIWLMLVAISKRGSNITQPGSVKGSSQTSGSRIILTSETTTIALYYSFFLFLLTFRMIIPMARIKILKEFPL